MAGFSTSTVRRPVTPARSGGALAAAGGEACQAEAEQCERTWLRDVADIGAKRIENKIPAAAAAAVIETQVGNVRRGQGEGAAAADIAAFQNAAVAGVSGVRRMTEAARREACIVDFKADATGQAKEVNIQNVGRRSARMRRPAPGWSQQCHWHS
jgi:hypothetical protein